MNEAQKNKPSRRIRLILLIWLASFIAITLVTGIILVTTDHAPKKLPDILLSLSYGILSASALVCLLAFFRWVSCWRNIRRTLVGLAVFATLAAIFYTVEDWRGKHAWENCKRAAEAEGMVLDWNKFLPPSVPDDQNFYTASSNILLSFQRIPEDNTNEIKAANKSQWLKLNPIGKNGAFPFPRLDVSLSGPIIVAKIIISNHPASVVSSSNNLRVAINDPAAPKHVQDLVHTTIGQTIHGVQGFEFSERNLADIQPAQIFMQADTPPSVADLAAFIPPDTIGEKGRLQVVATADPKIFQVQLTKNYIQITAANDYLKWSEQFVPAFDEVREALKRPYAIIPGDYSEPFKMPIPDFVTMRSLAQTLGQRAQCYLLLGEPDKALHELTLIHDVCRILEKPPAGQPETLVEAMIKVAITGLYTQIISEGLQHHEWQEPQLIALQEQLAGINLPMPVVRAFKFETAASTHTLETTPPGRLVQWFSAGTPATKKPSLWQNITNGKWVLMWLIPRGWIYQNMAVIGSLRWADGFDAENETISPAKIDENTKTLEKITRYTLPYHILASMVVPNFTRAWQTTAYNQTLVNEAQIACALERCRLDHGEYPDSLDMLVPKYIETLPHDIIGGQPLHYRRTEDRNFLLYSIGWNETDDGGKESPKGNNGIDFGRGDWVWKN
jgi:hypothetical protein